MCVGVCVAPPRGEATASLPTPYGGGGLVGAVECQEPRGGAEERLCSMGSWLAWFVEGEAILRERGWGIVGVAGPGSLA